MAEKRTIGQILLNLGRIDENDVERALEYQREHGGFFGEALVGLEILSQGELDWGLASQFDLPYVMPDADAVDPEAVDLVTPEWALANLTLPIMKTAETLTVLVDSPIKSDALDVLAIRTDLEIQPALATAGKIRELIRQVYAKQSADDSDRAVAPPSSLPDAMEKVSTSGATRFGVSSRGPRAWLWYASEGKVARRPLTGAWRDAMEDLLSPPPSELLVEGANRADWTGRVDFGGSVVPVEVNYLSAPNGEEFLFRAVQQRTRAADRFDPPSQGIVSEVNLLARSGSARFAVFTEPEELGEELIPHIAVILMDRSWRSVLVSDRLSEHSGEVFSVILPEDDEASQEEFKKLRAFQFDIISTDMHGVPEEWAELAMDVAAVAFMRWPAGGRKQAAKAGVKWEISVTRTGDEGLSWSLEPIK